MENTTTGTIVSAKKQWWLKINTKAVRRGTLDGALFPYVIKVRYEVEGKEYVRRKWIMRKGYEPVVGDTVRVYYDVMKPERITLSF
jgi:hypothetical protein